MYTFNFAMNNDIVLFLPYKTYFFTYNAYSLVEFFKINVIDF